MLTVFASALLLLLLVLVSLLPPVEKWRSETSREMTEAAAWRRQRLRRFSAAFQFLVIRVEMRPADGKTFLPIIPAD